MLSGTLKLTYTLNAASKLETKVVTSMRWMDVTTHTSEMKKFFARSTANVLKRGALASTSTPVEVASKASTALSSMSVVLLTPTMRNTSTGTLVLPQHPHLVQSVDDSDLRSGHSTLVTALATDTTLMKFAVINLLKATKNLEQCEIQI